MTQFQVQKHDINQTRMVDVDSNQPLVGGQVRVAIDSFGFSANNITYWTLGEKMNYFQFFPTTNDETSAWGIIPVWGFAQVVDSAHPDVPVGERLYGYFPTAETWVMQPEKVNEMMWLDGSEHRQSLPVSYNWYRRVAAEPNYDPANDAFRMLLFPLHITAYCLFDLLQSNQWYEAEQIIIVSASSKTSLGLAIGLHAEDQTPNLIGITGQANQSFVDATGYYDQVFNYDAVQQVDNKKSVIIDMSGNGQFLSHLHAHLGDNMLFNWHVGLTHGSANKPQAGYLADRSQVFFAPSHIQQRYQDWGPAQFEQQANQYMLQAAQASSQWLQVKQLDGLLSLQTKLPDINLGQLPADQGLVIKL